jgi:hypothetical protein
MVAVVPLFCFDSWSYGTDSVHTVGLGSMTFPPTKKERFWVPRSKSRPIQVLSVRNYVTHDPESRVLVAPPGKHSSLSTPGSSSTTGSFGIPECRGLKRRRTTREASNKFEHFNNTPSAILAHQLLLLKSHTTYSIVSCSTYSTNHGGGRDCQRRECSGGNCYY